MELTRGELLTLSTRHALSFEANELRDRLLDAGQIFCSCCKTPLPLSYFPRSKRGRAGRRTRCFACDSAKRRANIKPLGPRPEVEQRYYVENHDAVRERQNNHYHATKQLTGPRPILVSTAEARRHTYERRLNCGMSPRQAKYMEPLPAALQARWDAVKRPHERKTRAQANTTVQADRDPS